MSKFTDEIIKHLSGPLAREHVKERTQAGRQLSYIEGWFAISEANRIFGFDAWNRETVDLRMVAEHARRIGREPNAKDGWGVSYIAKVRVTIGDVVREGFGAGHGIDVDLGLAHESASKEAETDAFKRAVMTFGNPFGLALYDKTQANVVETPVELSPAVKAAEESLVASAKEGLEALKKTWVGLDPDLRQAFGTVALQRFKDIATAADQQRKAA